MFGRAFLYARRWACDTVVVCGSALRIQPDRKFVIWGPGRTGSTLFTSICNTHPAINCDGELLEQRRAFPRILPDARAAMAPTNTYGFKLKHFHLSVQRIRDEEGFIRRLQDHGWKFIFLHRGSFTKQALSLVLARARNLWHTLDLRSLEEVRLDPDEVFQVSNQIRRSDEIYRRYIRGYPFLEVSYEDGPAQEEARRWTFERVAGFLDLENRFDVRSSMKRTAGESPATYVANFKEVRNRLALRGLEL